MLSPTTGLLALVVSAFGVQPAPPTTMKYRIDQSLKQEIDASANGGKKEKISFTTSSFVTVTLSDSAGGKTIRVVVDSIRGDSATPLPASVLDSARGAEFRGFLESSGKPTSLRPTGAGAAVVPIQSLLSDFFPWTRSGLRVGAAWADTTAKSDGVGSDSVTVRRVSTYKVVANETRASKRAVRVAQNFTSSVAGTQPTPQGPARIEGTGQGTGSYYLGTDGRYLGGTWQQHSSLSISGSFAPKPLPITIAQKTEVSTIR